MTKNRDRVGKKYGFREGDNFMGQGGGREGELFKEMKENFNSRQKLAIFLALQEFFQKNSRKC